MAGYPWPLGSCLDQDKGFQGFFVPGVTIVQPKKKPRGGDLTPPEQPANRQISSIRMRIEHVIWRGETQQDREGHPPPLEGWHAGCCHGNMLWLA